MSYYLLIEIGMMHTIYSSQSLWMKKIHLFMYHSDFYCLSFFKGPGLIWSTLGSIDTLKRYMPCLCRVMLCRTCPRHAIDTPNTVGYTILGRTCLSKIFVHVAKRHARPLAREPRVGEESTTGEGTKGREGTRRVYAHDNS